MRIGLRRGTGVDRLIETLLPGRKAYDVKKIARNVDRQSDKSMDLDVNEFKTFLWTVCDSKFAFSSEWNVIVEKFLEPLLQRIEAKLKVMESATVDTAGVIRGNGFTLVCADKLPRKVEAVSGLDESLLGSGSFGQVYAARGDRDKQMYAIKVVSFEGKTRKQQERIDRECTLMAKLFHPNMVAYKYNFDKKPNLFIVMEFCSGGDLAGMIQRGETQNFSTDRVKKYTLQIARALKYLHDEKKIIHRDLKSDNIMVHSEPGKDDVLKIADLGLAVEGVGGQADLKTSVIKTTAETRGGVVYRAPEIQPHHGSFDTWALGLIVTEIVVGKFVHMYGRFMRSGLYPASKDRKLIEELVGEVARKNDDDLTAVVKGLLRDDAKQRLSASKVMQKLDPQYTLNQIGGKVDSMDQKLSKMQRRLDGLFNTVLNLNMDPNLKFIPRYVVLVPGNYKVNDGVFGFFSNIASRVAEWTGITETFHLWICDEGPSLLGLKKPPQAPMHDPLQIQIPGATLRRMAPLLRVMSALLVAAKFTASASATGLGNVIPDGLPFVKNLKKKADEWSNMAEQLVEAEDALADLDVDVDESAETAQGGIDTKEAVSGVGLDGKSKRAVGECYKVLKELLVDAKVKPVTMNEDTLQDLLGTIVVRVVHPDKGSIHWVAKKHLPALEKKGFKFTDAVDAKGVKAPGPGNQPPSQCCTIV